MKKLYIARHAKSDWNNVLISDFDRDLNDRGRKDVEKVAHNLYERKVCLDLILSSPAKRARLTAYSLADGLGYARTDIVFRDSIYESSSTNIIMIIKELDEKFKNVLLVGHNPSLTAVVDSIGEFNISNLPTCAVTAFDIDSEWCKLSPKTTKFVFYVYPKNILV